MCIQMEYGSRTLATKEWVWKCWYKCWCCLKMVELLLVFSCFCLYILQISVINQNSKLRKVYSWCRKLPTTQLIMNHESLMSLVMNFQKTATLTSQKSSKLVIFLLIFFICLSWTKIDKFKHKNRLIEKLALFGLDPLYPMQDVLSYVSLLALLIIIICTFFPQKSHILLF